MITLYCDTCGAPVDRNDAWTIRHTFDYPRESGQTLHGAMIAYRCTNPTRAPGDCHIWGKLRIMARLRFGSMPVRLCAVCQNEPATDSCAAQCGKQLCDGCGIDSDDGDLFCPECFDAEETA